MISIWGEKVSKVTIMCIMLLTLELLNIISQNIALFTDPTSIIPQHGIISVYWYFTGNTYY